MVRIVFVLLFAVAGVIYLVGAPVNACAADQHYYVTGYATMFESLGEVAHYVHLVQDLQGPPGVADGYWKSLMAKGRAEYYTGSGEVKLLDRFRCGIGVYCVKVRERLGWTTDLNILVETARGLKPLRK